MNKKPIYIYSFLFITILFIVSLLIRVNDYRAVHNIKNIEASYHTLLTVSALKENKISDHFLLPSITLGGEINHHIQWGATMPTKNGNFIYTSFYSPSFLLAYVFFKISKLDISIYNLFYLNVFIGYLTSLILSALLIYTTKPLSSSKKYISVIMASCLISLFSQEVLLSTGLVYWAQSIFNLHIVISLLALAILIDKRTTISIKYFFLFLCFTGPLIEWTGFIFNIGLFFVFLFFIKDKKIARMVLILTFFSGLFLVSHYIYAIGIRNTLIGFISRFEARTITNNILGLPYGYLSSYGLFVFIFIYCSFTSFRKKEYPKKYIPIIIMSLVPMVENLIMYQHATQFSFDRLKFIIPFTLICTTTLLGSSKKRSFIVYSLLIASLLNIYTYFILIDKSLLWNDTHAHNISIIKSISQTNDISCSFIATNTTVRGYYDMLFHRNIIENISFKDSQSKYEPEKYCGFVYIKAKRQPNDTVLLESFSNELN